MERNIKMLTMDETVERMIALADQRYNCSQIMVIIALEQAGKTNTDLVRAMSGLGDGCGFFNETCGVMTSAAAILGLHAGRGSDEQSEAEHFLPMLQELGEWFQKEIGEKYNGTRCKDIAGDLVGTEACKQICGGVVLETHIKINDILSSYRYSANATDSRT